MKNTAVYKKKYIAILKLFLLNLCHHQFPFNRQVERVLLVKGESFRPWMIQQFV